MIGVIELNDAGLLVAGDGAELLESPGYLAFDGKQVHVGSAAAQRVKLIPTQTHYAFWEYFGSDNRPTGQLPQKGLTQADLAHQHLDRLWRIVGKDLQQLVICVPADWQRQELGLLLGICQNLKIPVKALVNSALAASTQAQPGRTLMHLDLHLHRLVISTLEQGPWLSQTAVESTREVGLLRLLDGWAFAAAGAFVQATRFDPLHQAQTEQQLFDRLPAWLDAASNSQQLALSIEHNDAIVEARAPSQIFFDAAQPLYRRMAEFVAKALPNGQQVTLSVGSRLASLPGVLESLTALPKVQVVSGNRMDFAGVLNRLYLPRDAGRSGSQTQAVNVTRVPWFKSEDLASHESAKNDRQSAAPSHLLHHHTAYRLEPGREFSVGASVAEGRGLSLGGSAGQNFRLRGEDEGWLLEDLSGGATSVNGERLEGRRRVVAGDRIRIGSPTQEFVLIAESTTKVKSASGSS
ncbi:MAG: FHA domain-containing protein [Lysobacterales bacterium]